MFTAGFQSIAFQGVFGVNVQTYGDSRSHYQKFQAAEYEREKQLQKIRKQKTEAQKLQSVINEYERRRLLAEESFLIAEESEKARLLSVQNELINEINRLLMVKAEMMARTKRDEEMLILMIAMKRRRFRAF